MNLTVGQCARFCGVVPGTVSHWVDSRKLKGFRLPVSGHRRVPIQNLVDFMKEHDIPVPAQLQRILNGLE